MSDSRSPSKRFVPRDLGTVLLECAELYPVVTVTGPRQSGKTTLCRATFPSSSYVSLEPLDNRSFALDDPRGFLDAHTPRSIIDEIQHVPSLLSYIQEQVDADPEPGQFILTGSQHLGLTAAVTQSLAGRTALLTLLPLGLDELRRFPTAPGGLWETLWQGAYPRIYDREIPADRWLSDYVTTYLERDVRQVLQIGDLLAFGTFLRLAAGRTAQGLNLSSLGADAGVSHNTARSWLSVLETTLVCQRLPAWHRNVRKQLIKAPKLHFVDSGLVCNLLGIQSPSQLISHPLRGAVFESWVISEVLKLRIHRGLEARLHHYRERRGAEVDLVLDSADRLVLTEIKSGSTVASDWFGPLLRITESMRATETHRPVEPRVVYGGDRAYERQGVTLIPWWQIGEYEW